MAISLLYLMIAICMFSCNENSSEISNLRFELALLNDNQESVTSFNEDDPIIFRLLIINESDLDVMFTGFEHEEIFKVYEVSVSGENPVGKPYSNIGCEFIGGYPLGSQDSIMIKIPWIPKSGELEEVHRILCGLNYENPSLEIGSYRTYLNAKFFFNIEGEEYIINAPEKTINFSIK